MGERLLNEWGEGHPSPLAKALAENGGRDVVDLITANPQLHGFAFSSDLLGEILARAAEGAMLYHPDARGKLSAREAIAGYHGACTADSVVITPGTSFGYWAAFRVLCAHGDEILCPSPTYPLFDDLAKLAGARVRYYHLHPNGRRWCIDLDEVAFQLTPRTRAIIVVSPHNPTGSVASNAELQALAELAARHRLAIIFDEVFREFTHETHDVPRPSVLAAPLAIELNGFSKMLTLPGLKVGWMAVSGEAQQREPFLNAIEYLMDTFLPNVEPVQAAVRPLLELGKPVVQGNRELLRTRVAQMVREWRNTGIDVLQPQAGPYVCVPLQPQMDDEKVAEELVRSRGILMHPGSFYRMPRPHVICTAIAAPPWPIGEVVAACAEMRN